MFKLMKFIPLVALGKDVSVSYKEETGKDRPPYLSRRFMGAAIALGSGFMAIQYGVKLDAEMLSSITDSLDKMLTAGIALYGAVITIVGYFKRAKKEEQK